MDTLMLMLFVTNFFTGLLCILLVTFVVVASQQEAMPRQQVERDIKKIKEQIEESVE